MAYTEPYGHRKPPVSNHPLFPAVVALWFAALFGLGSFVLPNILFERIIVATGIAELVPSAAPPLGVTARLIVSATMALTGAWLGFSVARRIGRAQASPRPMRNSRRPRRGEYFEEPRARRPISARDELGATRLETPPAPDPGMASRRRALAMQEDDRPSDYLHAAPLPVTAHDQPLSRAAEPEPLDLGHFEAPPPQPQHQPEPGYGDQIAALRNAAPSGQDRPETVAPAAERTQPPAPDFSQPDFSRPAAPQQFVPPPPVAHHFTPPAASPVAQAAQQLARPAPAPAQHFAPPPAPDFARPAPEPLPFARPAAPAPLQAGSDPLAPFRAPDVAAEPEDEEEEFFPFGAAAFRPAPPRAPASQPVAQPEPLPFAAPPHAEAEPEDAPLAFFAPSQVPDAEDLPEEAPAPPHPVAAAPREPLDGLSMVDLAERLARSLGRHDGTIAPPAGLAAALGAQIAPRPALPAQTEPEPEIDIEIAAEFEDRFAEDFDEEPEVPAETPRAFGAPPPPVIPEALRPIPLELEEFGEDEDDLDLDLGLSFGRTTAAPATPPPGAQVFIADPLDEQDELEETGDEDDDLSEIAGYSSLLAMKSPFRVAAEYVRIEQPEPADAPAQPAVVFPGQQPAAQALAPEIAADPQIRRFDAPGKVSAFDAPVASRPKVDREEAERSLRSALATLQRMSGAA